MCSLSVLNLSVSSGDALVEVYIQENWFLHQKQTWENNSWQIMHSVNKIPFLSHARPPDKESLDCSQPLECLEHWLASRQMATCCRCVLPELFWLLIHNISLLDAKIMFRNRSFTSFVFLPFCSTDTNHSVKDFWVVLFCTPGFVLAQQCK